MTQQPQGARESVTDRIINTIEWLAAISVGLVALNIFVSVVLRKFFSTSIPDAYDFGRMLLSILIFWGIAATSYRGGHITVDLVEAPERFKPAQRTLACAVGAALFAVIAWCTGRQALRSAAYGDASPLLQIPTAWVLWGMCALSAATVLAFVLAMGRRAPAAESFHGVAVN